MYGAVKRQAGGSSHPELVAGIIHPQTRVHAGGCIPGAGPGCRAYLGLRSLMTFSAEQLA